MSGDSITYEQPLNERMRLFMRVEYLFERARAHSDGDSVWASRQALDALRRIVDATSRVEIKRDLIRTLSRQSQHTRRLGQSPHADQDRVAEVVKDLENTVAILKRDTRPLGQELKRVELLSGLQHNALIPGGDSGFELPYLQYWLNRDADARRRDLENWLSHFDDVELAVNTTLWITRALGQPRTITAAQGFYQTPLDRTAQYQLARVIVPADADYFAAISGNALQINFHLMRPQESGERAVAVEDDVEIELALCPGNP